MSETKRANRNYEIDRYFLMDSLAGVILITWRSSIITSLKKRSIQLHLSQQQPKKSKQLNGIITSILSLKHLAGELPCILLMWGITSITINLIQQSPKLLAKGKTGLKGKFQAWGVSRWLVLNFHQRIGLRNCRR